MMVVMMVFQLGFSSVLLGLVYASDEVRSYVYHCQQGCFCYHQVSYCTRVHLRIHISFCAYVSVCPCVRMCTKPSIYVHLCATNIPYLLHCDWIAKVHIISVSARCSLYTALFPPACTHRFLLPPDVS